MTLGADRQQGWTKAGLLNLHSPAYQNLFGQTALLANLVSAAFSTDLTNAGALIELIRLTDKARENLQSLKTACRAEETLQPNSTLAPKERSNIARLQHSIDDVGEYLLQALRMLPDDSGLQNLPSVAAWLDPLSEREKSPNSSELNNLGHSVQALQRHLCSRLRLNLVSADGRRITVNYSQLMQLLKLSDDADLQRRAFNSANAWFAEHGPLFADALNMSTYLVRQRCGDAFQNALHHERISPKTYHSFLNALNHTRKARQSLLTAKASLTGNKKLHAGNLMLDITGSDQKAVAQFRQADDVLALLGRAYTDIDPGFAEFLRFERDGQWIKTTQPAMNAGGTWCENVPSEKAVAIFANFSPTLAGAFQLAHPLGVGYQHYVIRDLAPRRKALPFSVLEVAGQLAGTVLNQHLQNQLKQNPEALAALKRCRLTDTINKLLFLPVRHRLKKQLLIDRGVMELTPDHINTVARKTWQQEFGDAVDSYDQYFWAARAHFFRTDIPFYDWQYTFGFLLGQFVTKQLTDPDSRTTLSAFLCDAAQMTFEALMQKHFNADITDESFWVRLIEQSINEVLP